MNLSDSNARPETGPQARPRPALRTVFQSSPIQLRAAAYLYGIESIPLAEARVLELGCGVGDNLLPFALGFPRAKVVGIDASADDIGKARANARSLGAGNARFEVMGDVDLDGGLGEFDYIILHQTYGKVPAELGEALLALCQRHLSPLGIAFVSYHTLPGWKGAEALRDAMLFAGHAAENVSDSLAAARTTLTLLADSIAAANPLAPALAPVLKYARELSDEELAAEFLQGAGSACYFIEFANAAAQNGLVHIGDAEPEQEIALAFGANVALFNSLAGLGQTAAVRQQYLDFAVGRHFRQSMLVHASRAQECLPAPDMERLDGLRFAGCFRVAAPSSGTAAGHQHYINQHGRAIATDDTHVKRVLAALTAAWPGTCDMQELVLAMPEHPYEPEEAVRTSVRHALQTLLRAGVLRLSREATPYDTDTGAGLRVVPHLKAALDACSDGGTVATWSLWHAPVVLELSAAEAQYLARADALAIRERGDKEGPDGTEAGLDVESLLERLRDRGLLIGSAGAWAEHFRSRLLAGNCDDPRWWALLDALVAYAGRRGLGSDADEFAGLTPAQRTALGQVNTLHNAARHDEAEQALRELLRTNPDLASAWHALARILRRDQRRKQAVAAMGRAVALRPLNAALHDEFSDMLADTMPLQTAEIAALHAIRLGPGNPQHYSRLAVVLRTVRKYDAAIRCCERALTLDPTHQDTHNVLGVLSQETGRPDIAEASYRRVLALNPSANRVHSNLLFLLTHQGTLSPDALFREHVEFGKQLARQVQGVRRVPLNNARDPQRPLRVGFVSGDLRTHAMIHFIEPIWRHLDREMHAIHVYHTGEVEDQATKRVAELAQVWRRVRGLDAARLRDRIVEDGVDILFDLSGHTDANRLLTFAMRAAPVQVSWLGYPATTGVAEMDYYLIDRHAAAPGVLDAQFTEKLVYLPASFTFQPHPESPEVNAAPALTNGHITFGSFNRYSKISDAVLALWARVLTRVPDAKMLMGHIPEESVSELQERFARFGVSADRIVLRPRAGMRTYLGYHHEVDIVLDTFPYTGGTTSCHSLWMGVPILSLAGETRTSRQTASVLGVAGLQQWVCTSQDELVEKAVAWASDVPRLAALRAGMRDELRASPFVRADLVAQGLQRAMRQMWSTWCNGDPVTSFEVTP